MDADGNQPLSCPYRKIARCRIDKETDGDKPMLLLEMRENASSADFGLSTLGVNVTAAGTINPAGMLRERSAYLP
jgi:hypothetical protein